MFNLMQDFHYTSSDGQIIILKKGTKIEKRDSVSGDYIFILNKIEFKIKAIVVESNPTYFQKIDIKTKLTNLLKLNSKRTAPKLAEILIEFIDQEYFSGGNQLLDIETIKTVLDASRLQYISSKEEKWLIPLKKLGWKANEKGIFKD